MTTLHKISNEWSADCDEIHDETLIGTVWFNKHTGRKAVVSDVKRIRGAKNPICVLDDGEPEERWDADHMIDHWYPHPQVPDHDEDNDAEFYLRIIGGNDIQSYLEEWREWKASKAPCCTMCDEQSTFRDEELATGTRPFCSEKCWAQYTGSPVKDEGFYGFITGHVGERY